MKTTTTKVPAFELALWQLALFLAAAVLVVAMSTRAPAGQGSVDGPGLCESRTKMEATGHEHHAKWHEGTLAQWQFLRGIYAMNPLTPPGLPYGDTVGWWVREGEDKGAVAYFLDGIMACTPMAMPEELLKMLTQIENGEIPHPGKAL